METPDRETIQRQFANYIRQGETENEPPLGIERRRIKIYQDLIFKNIEGFLSGNFPVLKSLLDEDFWLEIVSAFLKHHRSGSPYFKDIAEEFLLFMNQPEAVQQQLLEKAPPFTLELAHYEWVELVLDIRDAQWPPANSNEPFDPDMPLQISPLAWSLVYHYPVHKICKDFQPGEPAEQPTCLVVYRDLDDKVKFIQVNPLTSKMLEILEHPPQGMSANRLLAQLAEELSLPVDNIYQPGLQMLENFYNKAILGGVPQ